MYSRQMLLVVELISIISHEVFTSHDFAHATTGVSVVGVCCIIRRLRPCSIMIVLFCVDYLNNAVSLMFSRRRLLRMTKRICSALTSAMRRGVALLLSLSWLARLP